jgi:hypothetical protein
MNPQAPKRLAQRFKAHGFASPSFDEFALSRMKGVAIQAKTRRLASKAATKTDDFVCYATIGYVSLLSKRL